MCQTKKLIDDFSNEEFIFLDTVHTEIAVVEGGNKPWTIDIQLNSDLIEPVQNRHRGRRYSDPCNHVQRTKGQEFTTS